MRTINKNYPQSAGERAKCQRIRARFLPLDQISSSFSALEWSALIKNVNFMHDLNKRENMQKKEKYIYKLHNKYKLDATEMSATWIRVNQN